MKKVPAVLFVALLWGCSFQTGPVTPEPDGAGDCTTAADNLAELGCGVPTGFAQRCKAAQAAEAKLGITYPVGCLTAAKSCDAARECK